MLIFLLLALLIGGLAAAGLMLQRLWRAVPRSNRDFEWLEG